MRTASYRPVLIVTLLLTHGGLLAWGATRQSPTFDEVGHLPSGLSYWRFGQFAAYPVNPPFIPMTAALPVLLAGPEFDWGRYHDDAARRPELDLGQDFIAANGVESLRYFTIARWACIPFSLLGGFICYRWARELYGPASGLLALGLWCFSPNVLAHGQLVTPDAGATALGVTSSHLFWRWLKRSGWLRAMAAGIALGFTELSKMTWIVLFLLWPLAWGIWRWSVRRHAARSNAWAEARQLGLILLLGLYVLNLGYGFEGSFRPLGQFAFVSETFGGPTNSARVLTEGRNRFAGSWLGSAPVPVPVNYLRGIDIQKGDFERGPRSYLRGEWRRGGWWYYYLYALVIKVPLYTWVLIAMAAALTVARRGCSAAWQDEFILLVPLVVILAVVSAQTGFSHHLRYVLPILPFAFIWASKAARAFALRHWTVASLAVAAMLGSARDSMAVYPHCLSYFNALAGGPMGGPEHLLDSNIDWGQDLLNLKRWLRDHPQATPLKLAYFGSFDPADVGIDFTLPPKGSMDQAGRMFFPGEEPGPQPGWYAVSVNILYGMEVGVPDGRGRTEPVKEPDYAYFRKLSPVARAGYSIYIYHVSPER